MARRPSFAPSFGAVYAPFSVNVFVPQESVSEHLYYFAAVLNSRVAWVWFQHHAKRRGVALEINGNVLSRFPMRRIDFEHQGDVGLHDALVKHIETLLTLNHGRRGAKTAHEGTLLDRRLTSLEAEIDAVVDALYGLSPDDVAAVGLATPSGEEVPSSS